LIAVNETQNVMQRDRDAHAIPESHESPRPKRHAKREAWPRWLRRADVADYVGVSPAQLDKWVALSTIPSPRKIGGVVLWDRYGLDEALERLFYPEADTEQAAWDDVRA
jgi:predicted DNA-binding transcriptional regulator AlpA